MYEFPSGQTERVQTIEEATIETSKLSDCWKGPQSLTYLEDIYCSKMITLIHLLMGLIQCNFFVK